MNNADMPAAPCAEWHTNLSAPTGLTKREYFAGLAMQGLMASDIHANLHQNDCVDIAVTHADALLAELEKEQSK